MIRNVVYAVWSFAEGIGIIAGEVLDHVFPPEVWPPVDDDWTDGT